MKIKYFVILSLLLIYSCTTVTGSLEEPKNDKSSLVGLNIILKAPISILHNYPDKIYFQKFDKDNNKIYGSIVESNFRIGDDFFIINIDPGSYCIVGTYNKVIKYDKQGLPKEISEFSVDFDFNTSKLTNFTIEKNSFQYLGNFSIQTQLGDSISEGIFSLFISAFTKNYHYWGHLTKHENNQSIKNDFLNRTQKYFNNTQWKNYFE
jgi:hypothetical protein